MFKKLIFLSIVSIISTQAMDRENQWGNMDQPLDKVPLTVTVGLRIDWNNTVDITEICIDNTTTVGDVASSAASKLMRTSEPITSMTLALGIGFFSDHKKIDATWNMRRTMARYAISSFHLVKK